MKRFMVLFVALVVSATFTLTAQAQPKSGGSSKGGTKPVPVNHPTTNHPVHPGHPNPGHPHPGHASVNGTAGVYVAPAAESLPWQTVRYLRVNNQSGVPLTVYGQLTKDGPTYNWTVNPDVTTYLAIDGQRVAESQVYLWARSGDKNWMSARDGLTLVNESYQANDIGTFTYTFNP